jgi:GntR family transcriptional regulator
MLLRRAAPDAPKYAQLHLALATAINDGRWRPGDRVPSEGELAAETGLSLGTVQRALRMLADDGLILRKHGSGNYVTDGHLPMNAPFIHVRFLDAAREAYLPIYSKVLSREPVKAEGEWSRFIRGDDVVCIERIFAIDEGLRVYTHLYIDAERLPSLATRPLAELNGVNFKDLIKREHRLPLTRFSENLRVAAFEPHICKAIGVKKGTSGAVLEIVAYDSQGAPIYFQDLYIPPGEKRLFLS